MGHPVKHHLIPGDPLPQIDVYHQPATDNSGHDFYEMVSKSNQHDQEIIRFCIHDYGMLPLLAVVLEELDQSPKDNNHANARIQVSNAINFLHIGRKAQIKQFKENQAIAPPMSEAGELENLVQIPEGLKPIEELTEKEIVAELAELGLVRMGTKQIDTQHWLKPQLQTILMTARQTKYGRG